MDLDNQSVGLEHAYPITGLVQINRQHEKLQTTWHRQRKATGLVGGWDSLKDSLEA